MIERKPKSKKCKECKCVFMPSKPLQYICGYNCATVYAKKLKEAKKAKEWKIEKGELKTKLKKLSEYESEAKKEFQKWIRLRDKDQPCISCGVFETKLWDGGHYKKAELYFGVIFDKMNVHKQCRKCNRFLGGNELNYREGLISRYGIDYVEEIEIRAKKTRNNKLNKHELTEIKIKYRELNKKLI